MLVRCRVRRVVALVQLVEALLNVPLEREDILLTAWEARGGARLQIKSV